MKEKAILAGHVGEFGWECLRFMPHVMWKKQIQHKGKVQLVLLTRPDRVDLYGSDIDKFIPFTMKGKADSGQIKWVIPPLFESDS